MISCQVLEQRGKWRALGVILVLSAAVLPTLPLLWSGLASIEFTSAGLAGQAFGSSLANSALVASLVTVLALAAGWPLGVLAALYQVPGKKALLAVAALPLLVPTFLWAIGWSALAARWGWPASQLASGLSGSVVVFSSWAIPIVLLTAFTSTNRLSASQVEAARLASGERGVLKQSLRHGFRSALLAAALAGVLTLSDPAPGLIFGLRSAAAEILTSFSALYDFGLAGRQCLLLAGLVLLLAGPLAYFAAPQLASQVMPREVRALLPVKHGSSALALALGLGILILLGVVAPLSGIVLPGLEGRGVFEFERAFSEIRRTVDDTFLYALGSGITAALIGFVLAFFVGRETRLRTLCLGVCIMLFSLPPALAALGVIQVAGAAPAWADPLLRSRLTVCLVLGLRFLPVAALLGLQAWAATSPSWVWAAASHGVPLTRYSWKVLFPFLLPAVGLAVVLVALLATAEVGTVLLLHAPGQDSLPLAILTVMANAPQSLVSSLCLLYVVSAGLVLIVISILAGRVMRR